MRRKERIKSNEEGRRTSSARMRLKRKMTCLRIRKGWGREIRTKRNQSGNSWKENQGNNKGHKTERKLKKKKELYKT